METSDLIRFLAQKKRISFVPVGGKPFTLKSGRTAWHFMNISAANGEEDCVLAEAYLAHVKYFHEQYGENLLLTGPAYKGIPLVATVAMLFYQKYGITLSRCYNRKEAKDHGERGSIDGTKPQKHHKVVIIEDVITAGTSLGEMQEVFAGSGAEIVGEIVMVDRCESGKEDPTQTALQFAQQKYGINIHAVTNIYDIMDVLLGYEVDEQVVLDAGRRQQVLDYLAQYGPKKPE